MQYQNILQPLLEKVKEIGDYQLKHFRSQSLNVDSKGGRSNDLVTQVDTGSETRIREWVEKEFGSDVFIGEETSGLNATYQQCLEKMPEKGRAWVVDPLDGTVNFAHGLPVFAISVAMFEDREPKIAVVHAPAIGEIYWAVKGEGAFGPQGKLQVSEAKELDQILAASGFPYDKAETVDNNVDTFAKMAPQLRGIRRMGAASYDLCMVAAGSFGAYWELNLSIWDMAAGLLLVEEAGGRVEHYRQDRRVSLAAGHPDLLEKLLPQLGRC